MRFGVWELAIVLVIVLVIFGPGKLPKIGRAFGESINGFKNAQKENPEEQNKKE